MASPAEGDRVKVVASGFLHLLASQISTRLVTFVINLLIARHLSPQDYALSSVQFHLITTTILLVSREGFRRGCLRFAAGAGSSEEEPGSSSQGRGSSGSRAAVDNWRVLSVAWLVLPVGLVVAAAVCGTVLLGHDGRLPWSTKPRPAPGSGAGGVPYYREAVLLHGLAAVVELLAEPFYILASVHLLFKVRVAVEFASTLAKSVLTLLLVSRTRLPPALVFSWAQLALAIAVLLGYGTFGLRLLRSRSRPGRRQPQQAERIWVWGPQERDVLWTSALFTLQAVEKLALAEGSKVVLTAMQSAVDQGVYGLVANLGSLAVRTLFQPLEEAAFAAFSAWGCGGKAGPAEPGAQGRPPHQRRQSQDGPGHSAETLAQLAAALGVMTKAVAVLGLLAVSFGPSYSYAALRLVYGVRWSETEAPAVLSAYCGYVLLLALNGISEAFVHAVLDHRGLQQSNMLLLAFSAAHLAACGALVRRHGALGLVAADSLNMALRIAYSGWCMRRFFARLPGFSLARLLPAPQTLAACAAAAAVTAASQAAFMAGATGAAVPQRAFLRLAAMHVGVGVACLAAVAAMVVKAERATIRQVLAMRRVARGAPPPRAAPMEAEASKKDD